jgi:hypothetical protein
MWLDEIGRQMRWSFFGQLGMRMRGRLLESWCVVERVSMPPFIGQGREREDVNKHELPAMKVP